MILLHAEEGCSGLDNSSRIWLVPSPVAPSSHRSGSASAAAQGLCWMMVGSGPCCIEACPGEMGDRHSPVRRDSSVRYIGTFRQLPDCRWMATSPASRSIGRPPSYKGARPFWQLTALRLLISSRTVRIEGSSLPQIIRQAWCWISSSDGDFPLPAVAEPSLSALAAVCRGYGRYSQ